MAEARAESSLATKLPPLLSVIAGMVDVTGFMTLGRVFTAHITGNLVSGSAALVRATETTSTQLLVIPVFIGALVAIWLVAKGSGKSGAGLARLLLALQFVLLGVVLILSVTRHPSASPHGGLAVVTVMIAVCAMASQYVMLRLVLPAAPSTAAMTGNLTNAVLLLLERMSRADPRNDTESRRLRQSVYLLLGFLAGCVIAAAAVPLIGDWVWSLPLALSALAVTLPQIHETELRAE